MYSYESQKLVHLVISPSKGRMVNLGSFTRQAASAGKGSPREDVAVAVDRAGGVGGAGVIASSMETMTYRSFVCTNPPGLYRRLGLPRRPEGWLPHRRGC